MRVTPVAALASCLIFAAACSDSATGVPSSSLAPGSASFAGNPPPPPLTGRGDGDLTFDSFEIASAAALITASPTDQCGPLPSTHLEYTLDYLINKTGNNQWAHLNLDGQNRQITVHQTDNKVDATGEIVGLGYVFRITGGAADGFLESELIQGSLRSVNFSVHVTGIATLADGTKCRAGATLSGNGYVSEDGIVIIPDSNPGL
jgi:hypothetical protein